MAGAANELAGSLNLFIEAGIALSDFLSYVINPYPMPYSMHDLNSISTPDIIIYT